MLGNMQFSGIYRHVCISNPTGDLYLSGYCTSFGREFSGGQYSSSFPLLENLHRVQPLIAKKLARRGIGPNSAAQMRGLFCPIEWYIRRNPEKRPAQR